jgi:lambda family phage portal protein
MNRLQKAWRVLTGKPQKRMYAAARPSRTTSGWYSATSSADSEIQQSLTGLRGRSRTLCRDSAYAKKARGLVVNNVIGDGMGLQAQVKSTRGRLQKNINASIEDAWSRWSEAQFCHTGGTLAFSDFERLLMGEIFEAGEVFVRMHFRPFGGGRVPFALELIESERVPHEFVSVATSEKAYQGIELDGFYRPVAYWVLNTLPNELLLTTSSNSNEAVRVPAAEMIHLRILDRWPQTRGVPWLHAVAKSLNDMDGYSDAEITAARGAANYMGWLESSDLEDPDVAQQEDGTYETTLSPGIIGRGPPGSKMDFFAPNRPNAVLPDFMAYMIRQAAAGIMGLTYESLSVDYSQSNYSSSRLALLDSRDAWRVLQGWFIRSFRDPVHRLWLQQAVLSGAVDGIAPSDYLENVEKYQAVRYKPRGWMWVDPAKEIAAYKDALKAGFTTRTQIIAATGGGLDVEDVDTERASELEAQEELDLEYDTDPDAYMKEQPGAAPAAAKPTQDQQDMMDQQEQNGGRNLRAIK